jgi:4-aminobutyrate aminotransferase-like enzyme
MPVEAPPKSLPVINPAAKEAPARTEVQSLYDQYVVNTANRGLTLVRGKGRHAWDEQGKQYLDLGGGVAVNSLGHAHPAIHDVLARQSEVLIHSSNLYYNEQQGRLAKRIVQLTGPGKVFFCNSGAEANEALIKLARKYGHETGRHEIITAKNSFHGRTMATLTATGQDKIKQGFEPLLPGFVHVPFNDLAAIEAAISAAAFGRDGGRVTSGFSRVCPAARTSRRMQSRWRNRSARASRLARRGSGSRTRMCLARAAMARPTAARRWRVPSRLPCWT